METASLESIVENLLSIIPLFHRKLIKFDELLANKEIAHSHLKILFLLDGCCKLTVSEIGKKLYISRPNVTPLIDKLSKEGLVERIRDKEDKRMFNIELTPKGKEFITTQKAIIFENLKSRLSLMPDEDLDKLAPSLIILKDVVDRIAP